MREGRTSLRPTDSIIQARRSELSGQESPRMNVQRMLQRQRSQSAFWTPVQQDPRSVAFRKRQHYRGSRKTRGAGGWGGGERQWSRGDFWALKILSTSVFCPCPALQATQHTPRAGPRANYGKRRRIDTGSSAAAHASRQHGQETDSRGGEGGRGAPLRRLVTDCVSSQLHWKHRVS